MIAVVRLMSLPPVRFSISIKSAITRSHSSAESISSRSNCTKSSGSSSSTSIILPSAAPHRRQCGSNIPQDNSCAPTRSVPHRIRRLAQEKAVGGFPARQTPNRKCNPVLRSPFACALPEPHARAPSSDFTPVQARGVTYAMFQLVESRGNFFSTSHAKRLAPIGNAASLKL